MEATSPLSITINRPFANFLSRKESSRKSPFKQSGSSCEKSLQVFFSLNREEKKQTMESSLFKANFVFFFSFCIVTESETKGDEEEIQNTKRKVRLPTKTKLELTAT